jgi:hypothetical protein
MHTSETYSSAVTAHTMLPVHVPAKKLTERSPKNTRAILSPLGISPRLQAKSARVDCFKYQHPIKHPDFDEIAAAETIAL